MAPKRNSRKIIESAAEDESQFAEDKIIHHEQIHNNNTHAEAENIDDLDTESELVIPKKDLILLMERAKHKAKIAEELEVQYQADTMLLQEEISFLGQAFHKAKGKIFNLNSRIESLEGDLATYKGKKNINVNGIGKQVRAINEENEDALRMRMQERVKEMYNKRKGEVGNFAKKYGIADADFD